MFRIAKHAPDIQDRILLSLLGSKPGVRAYRETWSNFLRPCSLSVIDTPRALMALRSARVEQTRGREPAPIRQALPNPFRSLRGRRPQSLFAPREAWRPDHGGSACQARGGICGGCVALALLLFELQPLGEFLLVECLS